MHDTIESELSKMNKVNELDKVSIKKNAILNVIKQIMKIAFPLITFPYVSRILLDENFGKYNFAQSIINYYILIAGLGVATYGIREGARLRNYSEKLNNFANQLFTINLLSTIVSYLLLLLLCLLWRKLDSYQNLIIILSGVMLFNTLGADWINSIYEDYGYMTKRYIVIKSIALVLIFVFIKEKEDYLKYGCIIAGTDMLANLINVFYVKKYVHLRIAKPHISKHLAPLFILLANTIAITIYTNSDITMLGIFQNDSVVGVYGVASKMNQIVKNLINAIIVVIIPRLAALLGNNEIDKYNALLRKTIKAIITFMLPMIVGMIVLSKDIILLFGGKAYIEGFHSLRILSIALVPTIIASIFFDGILIVNRREKYCLLATIISAVLNIFLNLILIPVLSLNGAAITTVIAELCSCLMAMYFSRGFYNMKFRIDRDIMAVLVGTLAVAIICVINSIWISGLIMIAIDVLLATILYFVIQVIFKNSVVMSVLGTIKKKFV